MFRDDRSLTEVYRRKTLCQSENFPQGEEEGGGRGAKFETN